MNVIDCFGRFTKNVVILDCFISGAFENSRVFFNNFFFLRLSPKRDGSRNNNNKI